MEKIIILALIVLTIGLWVWALIDISKLKFKKRYLNIIWFLIVVIFPILGSIFYFQLKNKLIKNRPRKFQPNFNKTQ